MARPGARCRAPAPTRGMIPTAVPACTWAGVLRDLGEGGYGGAPLAYMVAGAMTDGGLMGAPVLGGLWAGCPHDWVLWRRRLCARFFRHIDGRWRRVASTDVDARALVEKHARMPPMDAATRGMCAMASAYFALRREVVEFWEERRAYADASLPQRTRHMRPAPPTPVPELADKHLVQVLLGPFTAAATRLVAHMRRLDAVGYIQDAPWWLRERASPGRGARDTAVEMVATSPAYMARLHAEYASDEPDSHGYGIVSA